MKLDSGQQDLKNKILWYNGSIEKIKDFIRMNNKTNIYTYSLKKTIPVMVGYLFLGTAYGILMEKAGFGIGWAMAMSILVYAGSLQYASIPMLASLVHPIYAFLMALMINARHLFYGISMLGKYNKLGKKKIYLIFGLTDETFSVVCDEKVPENMNVGKVYLLITLFDQCYWVIGTLVGTIAGAFIKFNSTGLDFALTALFIVIFVTQWIEQKKHSPAIIGVSVSLICLLIFGADSFIIPAMILIISILILGYFLQNRKEKSDIQKGEML